MDDYLFFLDCNSDALECRAHDVLSVVKENFRPLECTFELPVNNSIQFLDINLTFHPDHTCWAYQPRSSKPLLPFHSAHSKLVKRGIINMCFKNAIKKSCDHSMATSLRQQSQRLSNSGYPALLQIAVAESLLKKLRARTQGEQPASLENRPKYAVIPYLHNISHNLKKIAGRTNIRVVFSAPEKLGKLCIMSNPGGQRRSRCGIKHKCKRTTCAENVVYEIPLSCGKRYIGQTGRCVNDRLREHSSNVKNGSGGWLAHHCSTCHHKPHCEPLFDKCIIIGKNKDRLTREIIEAEKIDRLQSHCVSTPSVSLSQKELCYLRRL